MGERIGLIAGSGDSPLQIAAEVRRKGWECAVAAVRGECDPELRKSFSVSEWFDAGDLGGVLEFFKKNGIAKVLIAGKFKPEILFRNVVLDAPAARVLDGAGGKSPVRVIACLIRYLERRGIVVMDPTPLLSFLFCAPGFLTGNRPSPPVTRDVDYGFEVAKTLADLDIGQTVIVKEGMVIAVEGAEGTDQAIRRGGELAGSGIVAVKVSRSRQDPRIDISAVGLETVESLASAGGRALCLEAKKVLFFRREEAVHLADERGLSIVVSERGEIGTGKRKER